MSEDKRKIDIKDLPKNAATALEASDIQDAAAEVKGGVRATIRKGAGSGIRAKGTTKKLTSSSGDPGI